MPQPSLKKTILAYAVTPLIFGVFIGAAALHLTENDQDLNERSAELTEQIEMFDSELIHAQNTEKPRFKGDAEEIFPVLWTDTQDHASEIAVESVSHELDQVAIIVAPESERLGSNARADECWFFEAGDLIGVEPGGALPRGVLIQPEKRGIFRYENWCQAHGVWNDDSS